MNLIYKIISFVMLLCVCIFATALAMVNTELVNFNYYIQQIQISLSLLLVFSFIFGVLMTFLVMLPTLIKLKYLSSKNKSKKVKDNTAQLKLINPQS